MSVNVRWNGRGWPGKVPRSPVASPIGKGTRKMNWKNGRPKGTVKAVWQKTGMAIKKKKKKKIIESAWKLPISFYLLCVTNGLIIISKTV
jgi:hypothetical protein